MIESFHIQNFRCLRDVTLELGAFTAVVGPNASGKTALADAITWPRGRGVEATDVWRRQPAKTLAIRARVSGDRELRNAVPNLGAAPPSRRKHDFTLDALRDELTAQEVWGLDQSGRVLANLFATLSRADQGRYVAEYTSLVPVYRDVQARARGGKHHLQFEDRWQEGLWYQPEHVSDGSLLAAALLAIAYQRDAPDLVVIEDPDKGLHPYLQRQIVGVLRKLSRGELGKKPIQVVCTTHSRTFLDCLEPEEVRFISRDPESGETKVEAAPVGNPKWKAVYERYQSSLGSMWMTGALGGVPGN